MNLLLESLKAAYTSGCPSVGGTRFCDTPMVVLQDEPLIPSRS